MAGTKKQFQNLPSNEEKRQSTSGQIMPMVSGNRGELTGQCDGQWRAEGWCFSRWGGQGRQQVTAAMGKQLSHDLGRGFQEEGRVVQRPGGRGTLGGVYRTEREDNASFWTSSRRWEWRWRLPEALVGPGKELGFHLKLMGNNWKVFKQGKDVTYSILKREHVGCCEENKFLKAKENQWGCCCIRWQWRWEKRGQVSRYFC